MRGVYTANEIIAALNPAAGDGIMTLVPPADMCVEILSASVTNMDTDTAEQLDVGLYRITDTTNLAGAAITPEKHEVGDVAATATALGGANAGMATEPDAWATEPIDRQGWNNLGGYRYDPIPEERPILSPGTATGIGLRLMTAPSGAFQASVQIVFRELGG